MSVYVISRHMVDLIVLRIMSIIGEVKHKYIFV